MTSLPRDRHPRHSSREVLAEIQRTHDGPEVVTSVTPVLATAPYANKLGLGPVGRVRLMWAVFGTDTIEPEPVGPAPYPIYPVGTVLDELALVDDSTLKPGGSFICGVARLGAVLSPTP